MGLFGNLFGGQSQFDKAFDPLKRRPYDTPGYGDGAYDQAPQDMPEQQGSNFWATALRGVAGGALDGLAQHFGGAPGFAPAVHRARTAREASQQRAEERAANREDWLWKSQWDLDHQKPDVIPKARDLEWYKGLSPEDKAVYDQLDPVIASTWQGPVPVSRSTLARPAIGTVVADPFGDQPQQGGNSVPSGNPLSQPQAQQPSGGAYDVLVKLYGPVEGAQRYLQLIGGGGAPATGNFP